MEILTRCDFTGSPQGGQPRYPSDADLEEAEMLEPTDEELENLDDSGVETLIMEMAALEAIFEANRGEGPAARAVALAKQALEAQTAAPSTMEQHLVHVALCKATGSYLSNTNVCPAPSEKPSWTTWVYEAVAAAWLRWYVYGDKEYGAVGLTERIRSFEPDMGHAPDGAVELMALNEWGLAVEALAIGNEAGAKDHFERAIEIGSQIGSDSNPSINWTYAASFFRP